MFGSMRCVTWMACGWLCVQGVDLTASAQHAQIRVSPSHADVDAVARPVPPLEVIVQRSSDRAPSVTIQRAIARVGEAGYEGARLPILGNPYMELTADQATTAGRQPVVTGVLWLPFELAGERSSRIAEVDALVQWQQSSVARMQAAVVGHTIGVYGRTLVAASRVQVLKETAALAHRQAALFSGRLEAADATLRDARLAQADASHNDSLLLEAEASLGAALAELSRLADAMYTTVVHPIPAPPDTPVSRWTEHESARMPLLDELEAEAEYHTANRVRHGREAVGPINLMLIGGRGEFGDARVGAGLAYTFPALRRNQSEQARAEANRARAMVEWDVQRQVIASRIAALTRQLSGVRAASRELAATALPAAEAAVEAAVATQEAGKGDPLSTLVSRRDLAAMRLRHLELVEREWALLGELVAITGALP